MLQVPVVIGMPVQQPSCKAPAVNTLSDIPAERPARLGNVVFHPLRG